MAKIGFLGLGIMGTGMAHNLLKAGHQVTVWNRNPEKCKELSDAGAKVAAAPLEALFDADFVMYCLADDFAVDALILGGPKIAEHVTPRTIAINLSTIEPETSLAERSVYEGRGVEFLDAPVFGTKGEARNGGLWIVVGGKREI